MLGGLVKSEQLLDTIGVYCNHTHTLYCEVLRVGPVEWITPMLGYLVLSVCQVSTKQLYAAQLSIP